MNSKEFGTCSGPTPSAVAKKVVKKLCGKSNKMVKFSLKECKRGCERVCGPYQGRMEKLDRPYKRDGKTITHRVVCGKVKKMRGGRDLRVEDFRNEDFRNEDSTKYKISNIDGKVYIFFDNFMFFNEKPTEYFTNVIYVDSDGSLKIKRLQSNTGRFKLRNKEIIDIDIKDINDMPLRYLKTQLLKISRINNNLKKDYKGIFDIFVAELKKRGYEEGYKYTNIYEHIHPNNI
jgi:hypothetical protein